SLSLLGPDGATISSGSLERTNGSEVAASPDERWIAVAAGINANLERYDLPGFDQKWSVGWGPIRSLRVSPRSDQIGVSMPYGPIHLVDPANGAVIREIGAAANDRAEH